MNGLINREKGIEKYWQKKNQISLNGSSTHILDKNLPIK